MLRTQQLSSGCSIQLQTAGSITTCYTPISIDAHLSSASKHLQPPRRCIPRLWDVHEFVVNYSESDVRTAEDTAQVSAAHRTARCIACASCLLSRCHLEPSKTPGRHLLPLFWSQPLGADQRYMVACKSFLSKTLDAKTFLISLELVTVKSLMKTREASCIRAFKWVSCFCFP